MSKHQQDLNFEDYLEGGTEDSPALWVTPQARWTNERPSTPSVTPPTADRQPLYLDHERVEYIRGLSRACQVILGKSVLQAQFPAGLYRDSCRLLLDDGTTMIATRRNEQGRMLMEAHVMKLLSEQGAPVPRILGFNGAVMFQEDIQGPRLAQALYKLTEPQFEEHIGQAIQSLIKIHHCAELAQLDQAVPVLGSYRNWVRELAGRTEAIGKFLKIPAPEPELTKLKDLMMVYVPRFIKWDARPGNALVAASGLPVWIDWEHCGARNRLDDLVWLLADEATPDFPAAEERLLARYLPEFYDQDDPRRAASYFYAFGTMHSAVRLSLVLDVRADEGGKWRELEYCLAKDQIGVNLEMALRLCRRAARWAAQEPIVAALSPWFQKVERHMVEQEEKALQKKSKAQKKKG